MAYECPRRFNGLKDRNTSIVIPVHEVSQISSLKAKGDIENTVTVFCLLKTDSEYRKPSATLQ